ncbi:MAG: hypothetical protein DSY77_14895 [Bacteroidetes bacterium]|nr:MAG: hypothetical protein DSY77_14895 [Bacteroidota bacterium]
MEEIKLYAILECPSCHSRYKREMPKKSKDLSSHCVFCGEVYSVNHEEDCCIYCKHSNTKCPEKMKLNERINENT